MVHQVPRAHLFSHQNSVIRSTHQDTLSLNISVHTMDSFSRNVSSAPQYIEIVSSSAVRKTLKKFRIQSLSKWLSLKSREIFHRQTILHWIKANHLPSVACVNLPLCLYQLAPKAPLTIPVPPH